MRCVVMGRLPILRLWLRFQGFANFGNDLLSLAYAVWCMGQPELA